MWHWKPDPPETSEEWLKPRLQDPHQTPAVSTAHAWLYATRKPSHASNKAQLPGISPVHPGEELKSVDFETKSRHQNESSRKAGNLVLWFPPYSPPLCRRLLALPVLNQMYVNRMNGPINQYTMKYIMKL